MKVFISWSGARSKAVAELMNDWIKCVLQAARPWVSAKDIDRGALWFSEISDQLKETGVGIVCLTQENKNRPWILFETGALAKGLSSGRVCTFLIDLQPSDLDDPLAQFNHSNPDKDGLRQLVGTLNSQLGSAQLDNRILDQVFETYWPQFEKSFQDIIISHPITVAIEPKSESKLLVEILENTRNMNSRLRNLEISQAVPTTKTAGMLNEANQLSIDRDIRDVFDKIDASNELTLEERGQLKKMALRDLFSKKSKRPYSQAFSLDSNEKFSS